jgi:hypothetical protein
MRQLASLVFIGSSLVAFGCAKNAGPNVDTAEGALDSQEGVESEGNVMMAFTDGADVTSLAAPTPDQIAGRIAANVVLRWGPAS